MFVYPHKLILKTCGTTTLLCCLDRLFDLARSVGMEPRTEYVFYSRKSFMFPDRQIFPHTNWDDEVNWLSKRFGTFLLVLIYLFNYRLGKGSAYVVGKTNADHWYCFLWEDNKQEKGQATVLTPEQSNSDHTLEILMSDLCPVAALNFYKECAYDEDGNVKAVCFFLYCHASQELHNNSRYLIFFQ